MFACSGARNEDAGGRRRFPDRARLAAMWLLSALVCVAGCRPERPQAAAATSQAAPLRIVTISPNAAEIIAALGESGRLVAVSRFCVYPPELMKESLPRIGGLFNPDLEGILRLAPDLVVMRGTNDEIVRLCADNGIRLYRDRTESLADIQTTIRELGSLLGREDEAAALAARMQKRLDRIAAAVAGRPRPRVFVTIARKPGALSGILTASEGTFVHEMLVLAGGDNVFGHLAMDYPQVSPEAVLAARPDVIVEAMPEAEPSEALRTEVRRAWGRLGGMPAVRDDRIYILTEDPTLIPSPRVVEVVARLARLLHPEVKLD